LRVENRSGNFLAVIKVVGIGGGGSNAVSRMVDAGLSGVEFIAVNTDAQALMSSKSQRIVQMGTHSELLAQDGLYRQIYDLQLKRAEELKAAKEALV
jgi:cell division GTPase FtsZ